MFVVVKTIITFALSFLVTVYLVPLLIKVAYKFSIVDIPDGKLKVQERSTPYLGGLAIFFGFLIASSLILPFENHFFLFIIASIILLFVGLLDDLIVLTPAQKFFGQILAALCYIKAGFYLKGLFFNNAWNIATSFLWFLIFINAFNLIDVMDGLASVIAITIALSYLLFAVLLGDITLFLLLVAFIGAVGGFLFFNRPPAKIYLGDSGSLFLGGFLACVPFAISWSEYNLYGYIIPIVISAVPLLEFGTLILVRTYKLLPFYLGSPDHFSIFLQQKGWHKNKILFFVLFFSLICALISLLFFFGKLSFVFLISCGIFLLFAWFLNLVF